MKKVILAALGGAGLVVALSAPAIATAGAAAPGQASCSGATHGAFASVNGSFGSVVGHGGTPVANQANGQEPGATGYNNSNVVCS
jgi:hypothetical protein